MKAMNSLYGAVVGLSLICILFLVSGCSRDSNQPRTASVEGTVTYNGKPIDMGVIYFFSQEVDNARNGASQIRKGGVFNISTYGDEDGAVIGTHKVQIDAYDKNNVNRAPTRYANVTTTPLTYEVKAGGNVFHIELTDEEDIPTGQPMTGGPPQ